MPRCSPARRSRRAAATPIPAAEIPALAAATFTLSKLIVHEKVETWIRQPFVEERPGGKRRPRGRRLRYAIGELLTCTRCTGAWTALALVGLRLHAPATARTVNTVLASSAGNDFLHAGFSLICAPRHRAGARGGAHRTAAPPRSRRARPRASSSSSAALAIVREREQLGGARQLQQALHGGRDAREHQPRVHALELGARAQQLLEHRGVHEGRAREVEHETATARRRVDAGAHLRGGGDVELARELDQADPRRSRPRLDDERPRGLDAPLDVRFVQPVTLAHADGDRSSTDDGDNDARRRPLMQRIMS